MHFSCLDFMVKNISYNEIHGKRILEVGSQNVNGSVRNIVKLLEPSEYIGVDIAEGPGVDIVCSAENIVEKFGKNSFDVVISTEMLEHVPDWQLICSNLKKVVKEGGILLVTTRSKGMKYHAYPWDFWRYSKDDFETIFSDMNIITLEEDTDFPGVLLKAIKPNNYYESKPSIDLYSIVLNRKATIDETKSNEFSFKLKSIFFKKAIKGWRKDSSRVLRGLFK